MPLIVIIEKKNLNTCKNDRLSIVRDNILYANTYNNISIHRHTACRIEKLSYLFRIDE